MNPWKTKGFAQVPQTLWSCVAGSHSSRDPAAAVSSALPLHRASGRTPWVLSSLGLYLVHRSFELRTRRASGSSWLITHTVLVCPRVVNG